MSSHWPPNLPNKNDFLFPTTIVGLVTCDTSLQNFYYRKLKGRLKKITKFLQFCDAYLSDSVFKWCRNLLFLTPQRGHWKDQHKLILHYHLCIHFWVLICSVDIAQYIFFFRWFSFLLNGIYLCQHIANKISLIMCNSVTLAIICWIQMLIFFHFLHLQQQTRYQNLLWPHLISLGNHFQQMWKYFLKLYLLVCFEEEAYIKNKYKN